MIRTQLYRGGDEGNFVTGCFWEQNSLNDAYMPTYHYKSILRHVQIHAKRFIIQSQLIFALHHHSERVSTSTLILL